MAQLKLTKRAIDAIKACETEAFYWDPELKGLGLRVKPSGVKTWLIQYRNSNGRTRRLALGPVATLTPEQARRMAREKLGSAKDGADPSAERKADRAAESVSHMLDRYMKEHVKIHCRPNTAAMYGWLIEKVINPAMGSLTAKAVVKADVERFHRGKAETPRQANHALAVLMGAFSHINGVDAANPCRGLKKYPEVHRERFLSGEELKRLGSALLKHEEESTLYLPALKAVRFLVLTGLRLSEATGLRWQDVDFQRGAVFLPRPKGRKGPEWRAIGSDALAMLTEIPRAAKVPWVFPNRAASGPLQKEAMEKTWQRLRKDSALEDARLHDLRHTVGTVAGGIGVSAFMVRDLLGHRTVAMTNRYVNHDADPVRQLSNQVGSTIAAQLEGKPRAEVVPLRSMNVKRES
jgi:integrase